MRDLRLLGIADVSADKVVLNAEVRGEGLAFEDSLRPHIRERILQNRIAINIKRALEDASQVSKLELANIMKNTCPYISATDKTWETYAGVMATWLDFADLVVFDQATETISPSDPESEVRQRRTVAAGRRATHGVPRVQYGPIEDGMLRITHALKNRTAVDWTGFSSSTQTKVIASLVDLEFISQKGDRLLVNPVATEFSDNPERRIPLFTSRALEMPAFTKFIELLEQHREDGCTQHELGQALKAALNTNWKETTAQVNVKIMMDWARHLGLAPPVFVRRSARSQSSG
jgi:hypothetical protein